jgi:hypothetical protein
MWESPSNGHLMLFNPNFLMMSGSKTLPFMGVIRPLPVIQALALRKYKKLKSVPIQSKTSEKEFITFNSSCLFINWKLIGN